MGSISGIEGGRVNGGSNGIVSDRANSSISHAIWFFVLDGNLVKFC